MASRCTIFPLFTLNDISDEKRRRALERIFFHDILNTAGGLRIASELIHRSGAQDTVELNDLIHELTESLIEEIIAQRTISAAENGELQVEISEFNGRELVQGVAAQYAARELAATRQLLVDPSAGSFLLRSDRVLLRRVLGNMVKNALEASLPTQTVTIGCEEFEGNGRFWVHNPGVMPREIQLQVFQRSFSTKGSGRGLGTYSIKLLSEQYLGGKVQFTSTHQRGTEFSIVLPLSPKMP